MSVKKQTPVNGKAHLRRHGKTTTTLSMLSVEKLTNYGKTVSSLIVKTLTSLI